MSARISQRGSLTRALIALLGLLAAAVVGEWHAATGCFALLAALSVLHARRAEGRAAEWQRASRRDPLTGVGNYRQLHEGLAHAVMTDPERFAVLTMDVDSFKSINDRYGHLEGDRLLQEVSRALAENVRGTDLVTRQGGDEFAVIAPETDEAGAALLAQRIEQALARIQAADDSPVRASIGVAVFPQDGRTADDLLEKADAQLRATKARRRGDRVAATDDDAPLRARPASIPVS
jgi:two-component system cell cycle response regulator